MVKKLAMLAFAAMSMLFAVSCGDEKEENDTPNPKALVMTQWESETVTINLRDVDEMFANISANYTCEAYMSVSANFLTQSTGTLGLTTTVHEDMQGLFEENETAQMLLEALNISTIPMTYTFNGLDTGAVKIVGMEDIDYNIDFIYSGKNKTITATVSMKNELGEGNDNDGINPFDVFVGNGIVLKKK